MEAFMRNFREGIDRVFQSFGRTEYDVANINPA